MSHPVFSPGAVMRPGGRVEDCCYIMAPSMCSVNQTGWGGEALHNCLFTAEWRSE